MAATEKFIRWVKHYLEEPFYKAEVVRAELLSGKTPREKLF